VRFLLAALIFAAAPAWASEQPAGTGINSFAAGGGIVAPLGNDYTSLGTSAAFQGEAFVTTPGLGPELDIRLTGFYLPLSLKNLPTGSARIGVFGAMIGIDYRAPGSVGRVSPYFGLQVGAAYETMTFSSAVSSTATNSSIDFAARLIPGLELPLGTSVSALLEVPGLILVNKRTTSFVGSTLSLRFRL